MIVDLGPAHDMEPLVLPHAARCARQHRDDRHCYREQELENRVVDFLLDRYPGIKVSTQENWRGIGRPDIVTRFELFGVTHVTIIELKAASAGRRAYWQLARYVGASTRFWDNEDGRYYVMGVLGAFSMRPMPWPYRPEWLSRWWMEVGAA